MISVTKLNEILLFYLFSIRNRYYRYSYLISFCLFADTRLFGPRIARRTWIFTFEAQREMPRFTVTYIVSLTTMAISYKFSYHHYWNFARNIPSTRNLVKISVKSGSRRRLSILIVLIVQTACNQDTRCQFVYEKLISNPLLWLRWLFVRSLRTSRSETKL